MQLYCDACLVRSVLDSGRMLPGYLVSYVPRVRLLMPHS